MIFIFNFNLKFYVLDGNVCYYGICLYCNEKNMACAEGEVIEGSLILWLPKKWSNFEKHRHPYQVKHVCIFSNNYLLL